MNKFYLVLFFIFSAYVCGQSLSLGIRLEPTLLYTEEYKGSQTTFSPYCLSSSVLYKPIDDFSFEVRGGIFWGGEDIKGFEYGGFLRYELFRTNFYSIVGLMNHANSEGGGHRRGSYSNNILFIGGGLGFQKDDLFGIDLIYFWTNDGTYGYSLIWDYISEQQIVDKTINGMIRLGFHFTGSVL